MGHSEGTSANHAKDALLVRHPAYLPAMATKDDLRGWVVEALEALGGAGTVTDVAKEIWSRHEADLRDSGDLFYTWQYDMRWAAQSLRDRGIARPARGTRRGTWELT